MNAPLLYFKPDHDPTGQLEKRMFRIQPDNGIGLANATVTVVDELDQPIVGTDLIVSQVTFGIIINNLWGVTFYLTGGTPGKTYRLCCRYTLATSQSNEGSNISMRIYVIPR